VLTGRVERHDVSPVLDAPADFVSVLVSFVAVRAGSVTAAMGSLSTWQTLTTVAERGFAELESV
jgi:hypothetical protein